MDLFLLEAQANQGNTAISNGQKSPSPIRRHLPCEVSPVDRNVLDEVTDSVTVSARSDRRSHKSLLVVTIGRGVKMFNKAANKAPPMIDQTMGNA